jgi:hypothetical protein
VLVVERRILARLCHRRFYSLAELNAAIGELLHQLNEERPIRQLGVTRRQLSKSSTGPRSSPCRGARICHRLKARVTSDRRAHWTRKGAAHVGREERDYSSYREIQARSR